MTLNRFLTSLLIIAASISAVFAQSAQSGTKLEDPPWLKNVAPKRIVYDIPEMRRARVQKDLIYKKAGQTELKANVYSPSNSLKNQRRSTVIFIHGGYLPPNLLTQPKEWGVYVSYGQLAAASEFVGVTFNHRYYDMNRLHEPQSDVNDLVNYIRNNAASLGVDENRIFLWAFSGGGLFLSQALRDAPPYIRGIVSYYAVLDVIPENSLNAAANNNEQYSPLQQISKSEKKLPPVFIARAALDNPKLNESVDRFLQAAFSKNANVDLVNHAEGRHGFDVLNNDERSRDIIKRTIEFLKAHQ